MRRLFVEDIFRQRSGVSLTNVLGIAVAYEPALAPHMVEVAASMGPETERLVREKLKAVVQDLGTNTFYGLLLAAELAGSAGLEAPEPRYAYSDQER